MKKNKNTSSRGSSSFTRAPSFGGTYGVSLLFTTPISMNTHTARVHKT